MGTPLAVTPAGAGGGAAQHGRPVTLTRAGDGAAQHGRPVALTIAGSDSGGGAGVTADLKAFAALGVWGCVAITAVTAQDGTAVLATHQIPPEIIAAQINAVVSDVVVRAVKTGMLGSGEAVRTVAAALGGTGLPLVVDPVLNSTSGQSLLSDDGLDALRAELVPMATVLTPNLPEASALLGWAVRDRRDMEVAATALLALGPRYVLLKGGHLECGSASPDLLATADGLEWLEGARLATRHTHGTGCVLSAAVAAGLARGVGPDEACRRAKSFVLAAITRAVVLGSGRGSVDPSAASGETKG